MTEFEWHMTADETPQFGKGKFLLMGPSGGLYLAKEYKRYPGGPYFKTYSGLIVGPGKVLAWAEVPALKERAQ